MTPLFLRQTRHSLIRPSTFTPTKLPQLSRILLRLPPSCRSFHASPRPQFISEIIAVTQDGFSAVHSITGLPWAYSIPLFAVLLRTTMMLPLAIYTRKNNVRQISLAPLVQSWRQSLQDETMREVGHLGPKHTEKVLLQKLRGKRIEIYKRWGCSLWKNYLNLLQLPVFLTAMEALRGLCGFREGLLGMFKSSTPDAGKLVDGAITGDGIVSLSETIRVPLEASLATEGALWFPNLLLADPEMLLPFMLSGIILLNLFGHKQGAKLGVWQTRIKRSLGVMALAIAPIMLQVPSAMLIYWISSSLSAWVQAVVLETLMPAKKPVTPCRPKRPWRTYTGLMGQELEKVPLSKKP